MSTSTTLPSSSGLPPNGGPITLSANSTGPPNSTSSNDNNPGLASASLYLYTFLATLVLLLIVSAAIVVRSFILRRRHRMMLEALGNGYAGPFTAPYQRPRVDLSKKPKMWNTWIETPEKTTGGRTREQEWYWDMMKPFSATYTIPPGGTVTRTADDSSNRSGNSTTIPRPTLRDRMGSAARQLVSYVGSRPNSLTDSTTPSSTQLASPTALSNLDSGNAVMKVAVLIAMPSPKSSSLSMSAAKRSRSPSLSSYQLPSASSITPQQSSDDDEEPLPHLEIGVTEVCVVLNSDEPSLDSPSKRSTATE